jgi:DNA-binding NarL/FixJ family response regulator
LQVEIVLVDDHPLFREGFVHMARGMRPGWTVLAVGSGAEALDAFAARRPDLAIVDVGLPNDDGFSLLKAMSSGWPSVPTFLISGRDQAAVRVRARASGASGFVSKTATPCEIVGLVEQVLRGGTAFQGCERGAGVPALTARQAEVLGLLAEGYANKEIRHRLGIAERTVRAHLTELFNLLGAINRMQAVIRGRELGLLD